MISILTIPKKGDVSKDVLVLQRQLLFAGFNPGTVDGIFGSKTLTAVSQFQKSKGLEGSGKIGPMTLEFLGLEVHAINPITGGAARTSDLKNRRSSRRLHPTLRLLIEGKLIINGLWPESFLKRDLQAMVVDVCLALNALGIKEQGGNNHGEVVGFIQGIIGGFKANGNGDAWCASTGQVIIAFIEDYLQKESPVPASEGVTDTWDRAQKLGIPGLCIDHVEVGTMLAARHGTSWQGHWWTVIAILTASTHKSFEGNTGPDGGRDGDGAYCKTRNNKKNGDLNTLGCIRLFPNNKIPA